MKRTVLILLLIYFAIYQSLAQTTMNLQQCMQYAIENSPKNKIQYAKNDNYRLNHREAYLNFIPSVSGSVGATTNFGRSINPETNTYTNTTSFNNSYGINASYTIFDGFSTVNNYKITRTAKMMGVEELRQVQDDLCLRIIQAYFNVIYYKGMVNLTNEQLSESNNNLKNIQLNERLGTKSQADVLQAEALVAEQDLLHLRAENNLKDAIITLKGMMFFPLGETLFIDTMVNNALNPTLETDSPDAVFVAAKDFLPNIKISEYNVRTAKLNFSTAKFRILPSISLSGGYNTGFISSLSNDYVVEPFWTLMKNLQGEYIQAYLSIPIFGSLSRQGNRAQKKNLMKIAEYEHEEKLQEVETEVERAVQDMNGAAKEFVQAEKRVNAQAIAHTANQRKYDEGLISILDLNSSSNLLLAAKAEKLNAALQYLLKRKIVNYYKGKSYLEQGSF